jgi:DNA mismatch endonuclease, patch repair protein
VVFRTARVAVFVDGCYWHGCPDHYKAPSTNPTFWAAKVQRNRQRDERNDSALEEAGWLVIRAWEHEQPGVVAERVESAVRRRR